MQPCELCHALAYSSWEFFGSLKLISHCFFYTCKSRVAPTLPKDAGLKPERAWQLPMTDGTAEGRAPASCQPGCIPLQITYELGGYLSQHVLMHRNPECIKPPLSMTIKVQQVREHGYLVHVSCWSGVASLALGSRCLPRAAKPICHCGACLSHVYRNPNASQNGSFCHGPGTLGGRARTEGKDGAELGLLPSAG